MDEVQIVNTGESVNTVLPDAPGETVSKSTPEEIQQALNGGM